jgi:FlaA1/EpsC-like NDP-sugar epimerase
MYLKVPVVLLALIEAGLFFFAPYQAAALRFGSAVADNATPTGQLWPTALLFSVVTVISLFAMGLYTTRQRSTRTGMVLRIFAGVLNAAALSALVYYLVPNLEIGRGMLALTACVAVAGSIIARMLFDHIVDQDLFKRRVLVYGAGRRAASLLELRRRSDQRGFRIIGFIPTEGDEPAAPSERILQRPDDLYAWVVKNPIDEIVVAMDDRRRGFPMHEFLECRLAGIDIIELPSFL